MDQFKFDKIKSQIYSNEYVLSLASLLEEKTGAKSDHIILAFVALVLIMLFTGFGAALVCHVASFFYPFLQTISYIEAAQASADGTRTNRWAPISINPRHCSVTSFDDLSLLDIR